MSKLREAGGVYDWCRRLIFVLRCEVLKLSSTKSGSLRDRSIASLKLNKILQPLLLDVLFCIVTTFLSDCHENHMTKYFLLKTLYRHPLLQDPSRPSDALNGKERLSFWRLLRSRPGLTDSMAEHEMTQTGKEHPNWEALSA